MTGPLDETPLRTTIPPAEVAAYRDRAKASGAAWARIDVRKVLGFVVLIPFAVFAFAAGASWTATGANGSFAGAVPLFVVLAVAAGLVVVGVRAFRGGRWRRWAQLDRFARANGLRFTPRSPDPAYPGAIFGIGRDRHAVEHFRTADGRFLDFGNYRYTTGSGKNRTTRTWGYLALRLDRRLPHMVLDSRANNGLLGRTNLPATFDRSQVLSLEGDFDDYFTLYCPRRYERDALYVFTPDLMALLIDEAAPFDVEIVDDWMFVYASGGFSSGDPATYRRLFRIVETVGRKTVDQTERYRDERVPDALAADVVAPQGARLKRGVSVGGAVVVIGFVAVWGWTVFQGLGG